MDDKQFDRALIRSAFDLASLDGWSLVSVAAAARHAGLDIPRARRRFPMRAAVLARFGEMADEAALADIASEGPARDRLFDMLMRRIDVHQEHRDGVIAILDSARTDPGLGIFLALSAGNSLRWMLEGAGIDASGWRGTLRLNGLVAVWLMTLRAWRGDTSEDLAQTMKVLDESLQRADRAEGWLGGRRSTPEPADESDFDAPAASDPMPEPPPPPPATPTPPPEIEPLPPTHPEIPPPPDVPESPVG